MYIYTVYKIRRVTRVTVCSIEHIGLPHRNIL